MTLVHAYIPALQDGAHSLPAYWGSPGPALVPTVQCACSS